jgi:hypothetical protein
LAEKFKTSLNSERKFKKKKRVNSGLGMLAFVDLMFEDHQIKKKMNSISLLGSKNRRHFAKLGS